MKSSTVGILWVTAAIAATVLSAYGQTPPPRNQRHFDVVNCSALRGQPQVCVFNETDQQVTDIDCETKGFFSNGSKAVDVPKGGIPPHSMTVVNMKSCHTNLIFTLLGGGERKVMNVNTDQSTIIEVPKQ
jgi:hypothetical protein